MADGRLKMMHLGFVVFGHLLLNLQVLMIRVPTVEIVGSCAHVQHVPVTELSKRARLQRAVNREAEPTSMEIFETSWEEIEYIVPHHSTKNPKHLLARD